MKGERFYLIAFVLVTFAWWINGQESGGEYFLEDHKNYTLNCTIDGVVHYDDDCLDWLGRFFKWIGLGVFIILFLLCGCFWYCICTICRIICCTERPREVIYTTYVYPTSYSQMP